VPPVRQPRKDAAANRERVLDAATTLVRREGEKVPMADIAQLAGVGVGTVYRHFPSRDALLGALVHRSFGFAVDNARDAAAHPGSALEGIKSFFLATLRDRDRFVLPLHGGPQIFTAAARQRQADVRTALIVATSLLSRPLAGTDNWDRLGHRQIDLFIHGLAPAAPHNRRSTAD
jgi:AcrR family transcriptional regulator